MEGLTLTYPLCFFTFMRVLLLEGKLGMLHMMFSKYLYIFHKTSSRQTDIKRYGST